MSRVAFALLAALVATPLAAHAGGTLAIARPETATAGTLTVTSRAFDAGAAIPIMYARQGKSVSPPLAWTEGPGKTRGFVVLVEDPDAPTPQPQVHWIIFDVSANATGLPRAVKVAPNPKNAQGAHQGRNDLGTVGYSGPTPGPADPPHHYHLEVFALDRLLKLNPGVDRDAVVKAMAGHVLAKGELVATYKHHPDKPEVPALFPNG